MKKIEKKIREKIVKVTFKYNGLYLENIFFFFNFYGWMHLKFSIVKICRLTIILSSCTIMYFSFVNLDKRNNFLWKFSYIKKYKKRVRPIARKQYSNYALFLKILYNIYV